MYECACARQEPEQTNTIQQQQQQQLLLLQLIPLMASCDLLKSCEFKSWLSRYQVVTANT